MPDALHAAMADILFWLLLPAWIGLGLLDWICHRRSRIAEHCGPTESILHLLLLGEAGLAIVAGLFLEINAPILAVIFVCYIAHEITGYIDIAYAARHRVLTPLEQRTHDFMTAVATSALLLVALLHWPAARDLFGDTLSALQQPIMLKATPLPGWKIAAVLTAVVLIDLIPYLQELAAGFRAGRRAKSRWPRGTHSELAG